MKKTIEFGKTWLGEKWLLAFKRLYPARRLQQGTALVRKGAVGHIAMANNYIMANVKDTRRTPYSAHIRWTSNATPKIEEFMNALTQKPTLILKLLNQELDPEVLQIAEEIGIKFFPQTYTDLYINCTCRERSVPCKHVSAVIYKITSEIDKDPFYIFNVQGINLLYQLSIRKIHSFKQHNYLHQIKSLLVQNTYTRPRARRYNEPYDPFPPVYPNHQLKPYQKLNYSSLRPLFKPLTALLPSNPSFYPDKGDFKEKYSTKLANIIKIVQKHTHGRKTLAELFPLKGHNASHTIDTHTNIKIVLNTSLQTTVYLNGLTTNIHHLFALLSPIPTSSLYNFQPSTAALHTLFNLSLHLISNGAIIPQMIQIPTGLIKVRWIPAMLSPEVKNIVAQLKDLVPPDIFFWDEKKFIHINIDQLLNLLSLFISEIIFLLSGKNSKDIVIDLFFRNQTYTINYTEKKLLTNEVLQWLRKYYLNPSEYLPMLIVEEEKKEENFLISLHFQHTSNKLETPIPLNDIFTKETYNLIKYTLLQSLSELNIFIDGLDNYINTEGKNPIKMPLDTFSSFLFQMIPAIELINIDVLLPKSLREILKPKASVKIKSKTKSPSFLRLEELLDFDWQVAIGENVMSEAEFRQLLQKSEGLIKYKSQYIYVDKSDLEKLHKHFTQPQALSPFQILRAALSEDYMGAKVTLTHDILQKIQELTQFKEIPLPKGINATLRPYQERGYSWMYRNAQIGFGSVLADDMGLGKTLQVITTLLKFKEEGHLKKEKAIVVAPTGLLINWIAEIEKFSPSLRIHLYHGVNRTQPPLNDFDILLTSYGIARTDVAKLKKLPCYALIIDEAQNIKNANTEQSKAIKSLKAHNFIAMSGTPVENRLSELYSIMDYGNRGLLGSPKEFNETYGRPIEEYNDKETANNLKKVSAPFLMRRLKTDKTIISDLPDKIEIDSYATLTQTQASLYKTTLEKAMQAIEAVKGYTQQTLFVRQGLVLQMILALKQICNHPTQFLKNNVLDASLSGKLDLLFEKLESILENNEKVLIFTQFTEMGDLLKHFIQEKFKEQALYYHGSCTLMQRQQMVENFQNNHADRIFILSLKAAGTGLNLTAAHHVIHYDLWWNPAVEAQATDRAYRIGQNNNVMVHRFITKNTFEERINEMIQHKKALAEMTVSTGENWIGNLSNQELRSLFSIT